MVRERESGQVETRGETSLIKYDIILSVSVSLSGM